MQSGFGPSEPAVLVWSLWGGRFYHYMLLNCLGRPKQGEVTEALVSLCSDGWKLISVL